MNVFTILTFLIQTVLCEYDRRVITTLRFSNFSITPTVVNGKAVGEGQFPFLVSLKELMHKFEPGKFVWQNICGGSIITNTKVLTAAHCFEVNNFYYEKHPEAVRFVAGSMKTDLIHTGITETTADAQWRQISKLILHKDFSFPSRDIAVTVMDQPWVYNDQVNYVKLATTMSDYQGQCVTAGFGRLSHDSNAKTSPVMLTADIEPISRRQCSLMWEMNMNSFICTATAFTDVARGDSGGPLVCMRTGDPNEVGNEGVLVGIVSGKNFDKTSLFTRVSEYSDWIEKNEDVAGVTGSATGTVTGSATDSATSSAALVAPATSCWSARASTVNVRLSIIVFVLIYLLFYC